MAKERGTAWYRSKDTVPVDYGFVGGGPLSNKMWPLKEERIFYYVIHSDNTIMINVKINPHSFINSFIIGFLCNPKYHFQRLTEHLLRLQQVSKNIAQKLPTNIWG